MKVLFVCSGRQGKINPIIKNQGESLRCAGVELDYFMVSGRGWKSYMKSVKPLRNKIKYGGYDVIHAHYAFCAYLTNLATIGLRMPIVVSLMGSDIWKYKWYPILVQTWSRLWSWKEIIVKSLEMRERVGLPHALVIPNGVNMECFCVMDKNECQKKIGWDCSKWHVLLPANPADPRKNWVLAFGAVELLNKRVCDRSLALGNNREIELHGMVGVPNDQTPIMYNAADVVVLPSLYEGSANAVKEAMACNTPLVTTDMGDCRERIEGVDGCYVAKTYEVEEFAELLGKALAFGGKTKGRERILEGGIADYQIAERLIKIYDDSIKQRY